ncbi:unnamed protein product [Ectocarpus sp. 8 AP-2014]
MVLDSTRYAIERSARILRGMTFWGKIRNAFSDDPQVPQQPAGSTRAGTATGDGGNGNDDPDTPAEGFICPDCRGLFPTSDALVAHYGSAHTIADGRGRGWGWGPRRAEGGDGIAGRLPGFRRAGGEGAGPPRPQHWGEPGRAGGHAGPGGGEVVGGERPHGVRDAQGRASGAELEAQEPDLCHEPGAAGGDDGPVPCGHRRGGGAAGQGAEERLPLRGVGETAWNHRLEERRHEEMARPDVPRVPQGVRLELRQEPRMAGRPAAKGDDHGLLLGQLGGGRLPLRPPQRHRHQKRRYNPRGSHSGQRRQHEQRRSRFGGRDGRAVPRGRDARQQAPRRGVPVGELRRLHPAAVRRREADAKSRAPRRRGVRGGRTAASSPEVWRREGLGRRRWMVTFASAPRTPRGRLSDNLKGCEAAGVVH